MCLGRNTTNNCFSCIGSTQYKQIPWFSQGGVVATVSLFQFCVGRLCCGPVPTLYIETLSLSADIDTHLIFLFKNY